MKVAVKPDTEPRARPKRIGSRTTKDAKQEKTGAEFSYSLDLLAPSSSCSTFLPSTSRPVILKTLCMTEAQSDLFLLISLPSDRKWAGDG